MQSSRFFKMLALSMALAAAVPAVSFAQSSGAPMGGSGMMKPTKDQIETAIKATHPSLRQFRAMKPMIDTYKSQVASAPDETSKRAAAKQLMGGMKSVLSPAQQAEFKQSLIDQMTSAH